MNNVNKFGLVIICLLFGLIIFMLNLYADELKAKKELYELYETAKLEDYIPDMTYEELKNKGFEDVILDVKDYENCKIVKLIFKDKSIKNSLEFIVHPDVNTSYNSKCIN